MAKDPTKARVQAVTLLALHDRAFFEALLRDPKAAIKAKVQSKTLEADDAVIAEVTRLLERRRHRDNHQHYLELWDRYKQTGLWDSNDWEEVTPLAR